MVDPSERGWFSMQDRSRLGSQSLLHRTALRAEALDLRVAIVVHRPFGVHEKGG